MYAHKIQASLKLYYSRRQNSHIVEPTGRRNICYSWQCRKIFIFQFHARSNTVPVRFLEQRIVTEEFLPPTLNYSRVIIPILLHIHSTSRDILKMIHDRFMTAVPKEIFSQLEKEILVY